MPKRSHTGSSTHNSTFGILVCVLYWLQSIGAIPLTTSWLTYGCTLHPVAAAVVTLGSRERVTRMRRTHPFSCLPSTSTTGFHVSAAPAQQSSLRPALTTVGLETASKTRLLYLYSTFARAFFEID